MLKLKTNKTANINQQFMSLTTNNNYFVGTLILNLKYIVNTSAVIIERGRYR